MRAVAELTTTVWQVLVACALAAVCTGCGSTRHLQQSSLDDLRKGIADTSEHARLAMTEANQLAREQAIARVLHLNKPALSDRDFVGAVSRDDIAKWDNAFVLLDEYITALQYLTSPDRTAELENAAVRLGEQLASSTDTAVSPTVATTFTQLGKAIVEAKANKESLAIMQRTDGALRASLDALAQAIHDPQTGSGLRGTVLSNWNTAINGNDPETPQSRWVKAIETKADMAAKRKIVDDFLQMLDSRDAQLAALDRLRLSLGLLADAHANAAQGRPADVDSIITWINRQLDETKITYTRFKDIQATAKATTQPTIQP